MILYYLAGENTRPTKRFRNTWRKWSCDTIIKNIDITYMKTPLTRYTFGNKEIKGWVEDRCRDKYVLNLFAGRTFLGRCEEVRNDIDESMPADYHEDALDFVSNWNGEKFDVVVLDPPYSYRKSMEFYNGHKASRFNMVKDNLVYRIKMDGIVITFGYHSVSMGKCRGFVQKEILLMNHGGAIHDTIAVVEAYSDREVID
jgi:16S rRNA G966 N2-methylase RsmD